MNKKVHGRGALSNTTGRFEYVKIELDQKSDTDSVLQVEQNEEFNKPSSKTQFFKDTSRSIINQNDSPDIGFKYSMNFYRGCEHGCAYCYARPTHEYLGMSAGLDFESKIFVKENAAELLRERLMSPRWVPECIFISGVTDCYQPAERRFQITRQCLKVLAEFKNPVGMITKNFLVTRDIDIFKEMAKDDLVIITLSVTTLDTKLARKLEPRTSAPTARLKAIEMLAKEGIPVGVNAAPIIPGLTDHEMPNILKAAKEAGASHAGYTLVRLPYSVKDIFSEWLTEHKPDTKDKVLNQIREMRGGKLNNPNFHERFKGEGHKADSIRKMFHLFAAKFNLNKRDFNLRTDKFQRPPQIGDQLPLF